MASTPGGESWTCSHCGEVLEGSFDRCWNCLRDAFGHAEAETGWTAEELDPYTAPVRTTAAERWLKNCIHWFARFLGLAALFAWAAALLPGAERGRPDPWRGPRATLWVSAGFFACCALGAAGATVALLTPGLAKPVKEPDEADGGGSS